MHSCPEPFLCFEYNNKPSAINVTHFVFGTCPVTTHTRFWTFNVRTKQCQQLVSRTVSIVCLPCRRCLWQFKSSPRGRQSARTAADTAAAAAAPTSAVAATAPTTAAVIAVAPSDARQELPPPPQLQAPDRRTGPDLRNLPRVTDTHVTRKKRSAPFARSPRSSRSR